jgi:hypothetical protein
VGPPIADVLLNSAAQEEVPDAVLGRVLGVIFDASYAGTPPPAPLPTRLSAKT